ncbi:hypothetical protein SUGI_1023840 [Cryptomeria japonica]|uniref:UDP-glycosyltransferase 83A1-like n=1 Tax=Cryptomeria japonica TaxID=3369 RepID=UPI00241477A8|nr:UDP-glycosyltransferase 83A1-like [Cryptomeria japonica]GLJ48527.1 hypothetical protein SUGI_1023840 [Cryptomeria japonica]
MVSASVFQKPHALVVPFPLAGHINPMMQLAEKLVSDGFLVTFVNTEDNHSRITEANNELMKSAEKDDNLRMVCIPDGLAPEVPRPDIIKLIDSLQATLDFSLLKLIQEINENEAQKITCLITDLTVYYVRGVAEHFNIPHAFFCPASIATAAVTHAGSTLVTSGIVTPNGIPKVHKLINVLPCMPPLHSTQLSWMFGGEADIAQNFKTTLAIEQQLKTDIILFNSFYDLEAPIINAYPGRQIQVCPIGPLIPSPILDGNSDIRYGTRQAALLAEKVECLDWLDKQAVKSVVYVSFGSLAILNMNQLEEVALGLEATGEPFLWVVRPTLMDGVTAVFPPGFIERVGGRGCLVSWAPQLSVLSHPSIACFITHCGWNSTLESISTGVPMLCWPHFIDQFLNCSYVVNEWKVGLQLMANKQGIIERKEITNAVDKLVRGEEGREMKKRVAMLKESARASGEKGGSSSIKYNQFLDAMKRNQSVK